MVELIALINGWVSVPFRIALSIFRDIPAFWPLTAISVLTGLLMLWVFAKVSDQRGIRKTKDRIRGNLLGVRLYQHDVLVVLQLQRAIFRDTFHYMGHSLKPLLILTLPLLLILIQLNLFFGLKPLTVGSRALVTARFSSAESLSEPLALSPSDAFTVETPGVRATENAEVSWRIRADAAGPHVLRLEIGNRSVEKQLVIGSGWQEVSGIRTTSWADQLLYSGEAPLDRESGIESIRISYAGQEVDVFGWSMHWLVVFFVVSIAAAFLLKGLFGVEI